MGARSDLPNAPVPPDERHSPSDSEQILNILIASSEVAPFAKTGGLADVCGALPGALARLGHRVAVVMPAYRQALRSGEPMESTGFEFSVPVGHNQVPGTLLRSRIPGTEIPVLLIRQDGYFDRPELYTEAGKDYRDNCERFVFFCRAVLEVFGALDWPVEVLHGNDWQTGLIPAYLRIESDSHPEYAAVGSLLTIHNMAYQGQFWHWDMLLTGLDWEYFNWRQMEFYGKLNLLKTGIVFSDAVNTVSPRYAREIQTEAFGCGLEGVLRARGSAVSGILNGVDYEVWNPKTDPHLTQNYDDSCWQTGKAACKAALQKSAGLSVEPKAPLIGLVGRMADQKGWDLVTQVMRRWVTDRPVTDGPVSDVPVQWVILGTGDPVYQDLLRKLAQQHPDRVAVKFEFSDQLAHQIEAGADIFLMPSRFEPCGLNQLYSLRYGTVPVVRETGGLADTVVDTTSESLARGAANGFAFQPYDAVDLEQTLDRAVALFRNDAPTWRKIVETGMRQDWSWTRSAAEYGALYRSIADARRTGAGN